MTAEFLAFFKLTPVRFGGMWWAHEDGMNGVKKVELSHIVGRRDAWLYGASVAVKGKSLWHLSTLPPCNLTDQASQVILCTFYLLKLSHLVHTVQELQEDRCEAAALAAGTQVATLAELVAEGQPLFLQQHLKTLQSPIERIAQQLHQAYHLQGEQARENQKLVSKTFWKYEITGMCASMSEGLMFCLMLYQCYCHLTIFKNPVKITF